MHDVELDKLGHAAPPFAGDVVTVRVRVICPPPQETEQEPHELHADTTQSIGQLPALQDVESLSVGQALPPLAGCVIIVRVRDLLPLPHVVEHDDQLDQLLT